LIGFFYTLLRKNLRMILYLAIAAVALIGLPRLLLSLYANSRVFPAASAPVRRVAIVFGAGLRRDGSPSPVLEDRVATAAELYFAGKVEKLLMSGDNRFVNYNEPAAMLNYALKLGVPRANIVLDFAGRRTYDTCYRAKAIFGVEQALLVTQDFHLPRAVFTCNALGLPAEGVSADRRRYVGPADLREYPASLVAIWDVWVGHPLPVLGNPEPIFSAAPPLTTAASQPPQTHQP
jgi:SanA protein